MTKIFVKGLLFLSWAASMYWLVRHEAYPDRFGAELAGYRTLARDRAEVSDTWMKILFGGRPIGYSHGTVQLNEEAKELELVMENNTVIQLKLPGISQRLKLNTRIMLNASYELSSFELSATGMGKTLAAEGTRIKGERYRLELDAGVGKTVSEITIPSDTVLFTPYLEMAMKRMKPGETMVMNGMDPLTMTRTKIRLKAEALETIEALGAQVPCTRLSVTVEGSSLQVWIDGEGRVMRQTTPFGWIMEACTGDQAIALMGDRDNAVNGLALPSLFGNTPASKDP